MGPQASCLTSLYLILLIYKVLSTLISAELHFLRSLGPVSWITWQERHQQQPMLFTQTCFQTPLVLHLLCHDANSRSICKLDGFSNTCDLGLLIIVLNLPFLYSPAHTLERQSSQPCTTGEGKEVRLQEEFGDDTYWRGTANLHLADKWL